MCGFDRATCTEESASTGTQTATWCAMGAVGEAKKDGRAARKLKRGQKVMT